MRISRPGLVALALAATIGVGTVCGETTGLSSSSSEGLGAVRTTEIVRQIDQRILAAWTDRGVRPSAEATEGQWCRRVFVDLIGRIPSVAELDRFTQSKSREKRAELVDRLLSDEYHTEFVANWTTLWTNILIGRTGGTERRSPTDRGGMAEWLTAALLENKPYDRMVEQLLTATGSGKPGSDDFNGAVNFLVEKLAEDAVQATAKTSEIFLGIAVQCTQCHNHPFNENRQNQFWELNAFFRQARADVTRDPDNNRRLGGIQDRDFAGEGRQPFRDNRSEIFLELRDGKLVDRDQARHNSAPVYYELRNGQVEVAFPVFVDGTALADKFSESGPDFGNSGYLQHVERRQELADLIVDSPLFPQATANRFWAHFLGYGFTKPVTDMGPHNPASHPELLAELGQAFRDSGFNLKSLMRWIVLSKPYSLSSRIGKRNEQDNPAQGSTPLFSRFYVRQMQAEQLYESLLIATRAEATLADERRGQSKQRWLNQFNTAFGTDDSAEASSFNGSITQSLMMFNGELIRRACSTGSGSFLDQVATDWELTNREKIDYLYRAALARRPTKEEARTCNALLASREGNVVETLQDVWWAVLNSNEFILVH